MSDCSASQDCITGLFGKIHTGEQSIRMRLRPSRVAFMLRMLVKQSFHESVLLRWTAAHLLSGHGQAVCLLDVCDCNQNESSALKLAGTAATLQSGPISPKVAGVAGRTPKSKKTRDHGHADTQRKKPCKSSSIMLKVPADPTIARCHVTLLPDGSSVVRARPSCHLGLHVDRASPLEIFTAACRRHNSVLTRATIRVPVMRMDGDHPLGLLRDTVPLQVSSLLAGRVPRWERLQSESVATRNLVNHQSNFEDFILKGLKWGD